MQSIEQYRCELRQQLTNAAGLGVGFLIITASELSTSVGDPEAYNDTCFEALRDEIVLEDEVLIKTDSGSDLAVRFVLPRPKPVPLRHEALSAAISIAAD